MEAPQIAPAPSLFKKRSSKAKTALRKRPAPSAPEALNGGSSDSDSDAYYSQDESGRKIKRQKKKGTVTASSASNIPKQSSTDLEATRFEGDRSKAITSTNDATKHSNWYDEGDADALSAKNLLGKTRTAPRGAGEDDDTADDGKQGTYKGASSYGTFIQKNPNAPNRQAGPLKAPTNVRTITVTDYAPDVCKDYKQTGFCGYGDGCKYLHSRESYKHGWELDKEWEIGTKGKKLKGTTVASANRSGQAGAEDEDEEAELEDIPFACIICKKPYKDPIVTKCRHYFCESCALQRYRKTPMCAACGSGTSGVFNTAKNLKRLLERKREREERRRDKARENGEEVSEGDDE